MSTHVTLPPGCTGLDMQDGTRYSADRDGRVAVDSRHADAINRGYYGSSGLMVAATSAVLGTKNTRWCDCSPGRRAWNAWTTVCPRCGTATQGE